MARVKLIDPEQAEGRTHEVFERVKAYYKMVPGLQQALNYLPETTHPLWPLSLNTAMEGTIREELKRVFFAVTAYEVECGYCTAAHIIALMGKGWSRQECVDLIEGKPSPRLTDKENAAVDFARMVGRRPAGGDRRDDRQAARPGVDRPGDRGDRGDRGLGGTHALHDHGG